jgi:hypothetical protein
MKRICTYVCLVTTMQHTNMLNNIEHSHRVLDDEAGGSRAKDNMTHCALTS